MTALYIILAIAAVIALIIFIPIDVAFFVSFYEKQQKITLGISYSFLKISILPPKEKQEKEEKKEKTEDKKKEEKPKEEKEKKPLSNTIEIAREAFDECFDDVVGIIKHFFTHTLQTKRFFIRAKIGTGDPMMTGIAFGTLNAFIYNLIKFIDVHSKLYEWKVGLDADYDKAFAEGEADIIIRTRIAYILKLAAMAVVPLIKIIIIYRRVNKNG